MTGLQGFLVLLGMLSNTLAATKTTADLDICGALSSVKLSSGSHGNITSPRFPHSTHQWSQQDCRMVLTVDPDHRIQMTFDVVDFPSCSVTTTRLPRGCVEGCDHLYYEETAYPDLYHHHWFEHTPGIITANSSQIVLQLCLSHRSYSTRAFRISYTVIEHIMEFTGPPDATGFFHSAHFPSPYASPAVGYKRNGDVYRYRIYNPAGFIRLWFDDWNLSPASNITIYLDNTTRTDHYLQRQGSSQRPFVVSSNHYLLVIFSTGHDSLDTHFYGFKAVYQFAENAYWVKPYMDCGKYMQDEVGGELVYDATKCWRGDIVDCIWVIDDVNQGNHIVLRVDNIALEESDTITIIAGKTSEGSLITSTSVGNTTADHLMGREFIIRPEEGGVYVRLVVKCHTDRHFRAVFSLFTFPEMTEVGYLCADSDVQCRLADHEQDVCIDRSLTCDGINHCPGAQDEQHCTTTTFVPSVRCSSHYLCRSGAGWYCLEQRCDKHWDCYDGSDERNCWTTDTDNQLASNDDEDSSAVPIATLLPALLVCILLASLGCVLVTYYVRKKGRRQSPAVARRNEDGPALTSITGNITGVSSPHTLACLDAPPSYEESQVTVQLSPVDGQVNMAYSRTFDLGCAPPPYSPTDENPQYSVPQYSALPFLLYSSSINSISSQTPCEVTGSGERSRSSSPLHQAERMNTLLQIAREQVQHTLQSSGSGRPNNQNNTVDMDHVPSESDANRQYSNISSSQADIQTGSVEEDARSEECPSQSGSTAEQRSVASQHSTHSSHSTHSTHSTPSVSRSNNKLAASTRSLATDTVIQGALKQSTNNIHSVDSVEESPTMMRNKSLAGARNGATTQNQCECESGYHGDCNGQGDNITGVTLCPETDCDSQSNGGRVTA